MLLLLLPAAAPAAEPTPRDAHTVELGAGALPDHDADAWQAVASARAHGDHRLPRSVLLAWDLLGVRRTWAPATARQAAGWRLEAALGVGWHREWVWGDMRLWAGPSVEQVVGEGGPARGVAWLDPAEGPGRQPRWTDVGLVVGNDLDWPLGPVRLGGKWRWRLGTDVLPGGAEARDALGGADVWELHAVSLTGVMRSPVGPYAEAGWTLEYTLPVREPSFRVAPWLVVGVQVRAGRTR